MATNFPTSLDSLPNPTGTDLLDNATAALDHDAQHANANDAIEALQAKVGVNNSAVQTSHDYKLGEVTGSDKAVGKTATQTLTNKTLTSPQINFGSDARGDLITRNSGGTTTRLPIGSSGQILQVSSSGDPEWIANPAAADASTTVKGVVEEATQTEVDAGTAAGGTSARLFVNPSTMRGRKFHDKGTPSGGTDAYAFTASPTITAYTDGDVFTFEADVANTGTATLNVSSVGAKTIKKNKNEDLTTGDIKAGQYVMVQYDSGDDTFQLLTPTAQTSVQSGIQEIISGIAGTVTNFTIACATSGFSTTEPLFFIGGSSSSPNILRLIKHPNGGIVATHSTGAGGSTSNLVQGVVVGDYLYVLVSNAGSPLLTRYDKANLGNATTITVSGTALTIGAPMFSNGTDIYQNHTSGSARIYTISGTTITSGSTVSYTSMSDSFGKWSDGTSVYQINIGSSSTSKWAIGGGSETSGTSFLPAQFLIRGGSNASTGGIVKESGNTSFIFVASVDTTSGCGRIIPITSF